LGAADLGEQAHQGRQQEGQVDATDDAAQGGITHPVFMALHDVPPRADQGEAGGGEEGVESTDIHGRREWQRPRPRPGSHAPRAPGAAGTDQPLARERRSAPGLRRRHAIIAAAGPALAVTLHTGQTFLVTAPDPAAAASLMSLRLS
jgi:hypothetical protein